MWNLFVFLFFVTPLAVHGVLDGDPAEWHRHAYVVKILARDVETRGSTQGCSGVLVSGSLVLTVKNCVINAKTEKPLNEFVVILSWTEGDHNKTKLITKKRLGTLLEVLGDKAAIQIHPLPISELCPKDPGDSRIVAKNKPSTLSERKASVNRVSILPFRPSLFRQAYLDHIQDYLSNCRVIGFDSNTTDFVENRQLLSFTIEDYPTNDGMQISIPVQDNRTACLGDTGIPLECQAHGVKQHMQMGLLTVAMRPDGAEEGCENNHQLVFTPLWDEHTLVLLDKYDLPGFVAANQLCKANSYPDEPFKSEETKEKEEVKEEVKQKEKEKEKEKEEKEEVKEEKVNQRSNEKASEKSEKAKNQKPSIQLN